MTVIVNTLCSFFHLPNLSFYILFQNSVPTALAFQLYLGADICYSVFPLFHALQQRKYLYRAYFFSPDEGLRTS